MGSSPSYTLWSRKTGGLEFRMGIESRTKSIF